MENGISDRPITDEININKLTRLFLMLTYESSQI